VELPETLADFERLATERLEPGPHGYFAGGAADELTLHANEEAWRRIELRPRVLVETGVANGFSTAFLLQALQTNGNGHLHSIDLPREVGRAYESGTFFEGRGRAGIPAGSEPGWLIPEELRDRWTLILGRSQDELPPLLERLSTIDLFMHDSEHSFDCMWFEFNAAWTRLGESGVLVADDVNANDAFARFAREQSRQPLRLARGMSLLTR
jgi:hypothetical protein